VNPSHLALVHHWLFVGVEGSSIEVGGDRGEKLGATEGKRFFKRNFVSARI